MFACTIKKMALSLTVLALGAALSFTGAEAQNTGQVKAYLEITMVIPEANRPAAVKVYTDFRGPFLEQIGGAVTKDLLVRNEDVQVLHGFQSVEDAQAYLGSDMFKNDVFVGLKGLWATDPDVKIYAIL